MCFFFKLLFNLRGNGGGAGGRGTMTAAGPDSLLRDPWIELENVEAAWVGEGWGGVGAGWGEVGEGWGEVGRTGVGAVSESDIFLLGLGTGV